MTHPNPFAPATRVAEKLRIGIAGPSGSGKTLGALALARAIVGPKGRIAVIDTEAGSAALYADRFQFDSLKIRPPYLTAKFVEALAAATTNKYDLVVVDSISHQWDGEGGILQRKEETDARGGNHFSNWAPFTKEHNEFRAALLNCPIHLIVTMRSKQAYQMSEGDGKKAAPKKMGMAPIQREGMEYEFTVTFDLQMDHKAAASKDRTGMFADQLTDLLKPEPGRSLAEWLDTAVPAVTQEQVDRLTGILGLACWSERERAGIRRRADAITTEDAMDAFLEGAASTAGERAPKPEAEAAHV
jgi:DNA polymerase III delta prime subunit